MVFTRTTQPAEIERQLHVAVPHQTGLSVARKYYLLLSGGEAGEIAGLKFYHTFACQRIG
jgi:hypothetical protein